MKNKFMRLFLVAAIASTSTLTSCSEDPVQAGTDTDNTTPEQPVESSRWFTIGGAIMGTNPGDGNGGTLVYSVSEENIKNPAYEIAIFDHGFPVKSQRTARIHATNDGSKIYCVQYVGTDGGQMDEYKVQGGGQFGYIAGANLSQYVSNTPRWHKLYDNDKTGIAVNVTTPTANNINPDTKEVDPTIPFKYYRGKATVLSMNLPNVAINGYKTYELPLTEAEELQGHHIFRLDSPVLNKKGDKLIIGTWMRKTNPATGQNETGFQRLYSKSVVVDFPSLNNPKIITSQVGDGDTTGFRSQVAYLAEDGYIYQATQRGTSAHILRINEDNAYDNSYVFSLDEALGVTGTYVDAWRYVSDRYAYVLYTYKNAPHGYVAKVDLQAKTAVNVDLPYVSGVDFTQYQGFVVRNGELYMTFSPTGGDGNVYILNPKENTVTKGAKLKNVTGNHFIGVF